LLLSSEVDVSNALDASIITEVLKTRESGPMKAKVCPFEKSEEEQEMLEGIRKIESIAHYDVVDRIFGFS
jgi:hypothetical protein